MPRRILGAMLAAGLCVVCVTLAGCGDSGEPSAAPDKPARFGEIDRERLLSADKEPGSWLGSGRDFGRTHYSPLKTIDRATVSRLGFAWAYETLTNRGLQATPIVVDGVMYTSGNLGRVYALDARTGEEIWSFEPEVDGQANRAACCDQVNRGVAVWEGMVYVGALDGWLYGLDAATGDVVWKADTIDNRKRGYTITGAPEVAGSVVVIGNAGSEYDARGYVTAYDLKTGAEAWRFYIVPGDPKLGFEHPELEMAAKTWDPDSRWDVGGGGTAWNALIWDPELDILYVGTGNAALYNQAERSPSGGDNLFLASILAIDPKTGRLLWHYQQVPGERWDYTATQPIMLKDMEIRGVTRKVLMQAPKNGFFYILDRQTGELLSADKYVPVTWATHVDLATGRPAVDLEAADYSTGPKFVFPSSMGGHSWNPMAYSPDTELVYIPAIEAGNIMFDFTEGHEYRPGRSNTGVVNLLGGTVTLGVTKYPESIRRVIDSGELLKGKPDPRMRAVLKAWDPVKGETVWEFETFGWWDRSGVLATAGGLVFMGGGEGFFRAFDDRTGKVLKEIDVGSTIVAAPMTYEIDGVQYVAVMAGWGGGGWGIPHPEAAHQKYGNEGRILAFRLDGGATPKPAPVAPPGPIPEPPALTASAEFVARGGDLFGANCGGCHSNAPGLVVPDLRRMSPESHASFNEILLGGMLKDRGMPQWDDVFSADDAEAIHAYLISLAWDAYRKEQAEPK